MKWQILCVLLLIACAQAPEPATAPATTIVIECTPNKGLGEGCDASCECLKPSKCLDGICSLVNQQTGQPCVSDKQCLSGHCEDNTCQYLEDSTASYECERVCRDTYDNKREDCYTDCHR